MQDGANIIAAKEGTNAEEGAREQRRIAAAEILAAARASAELLSLLREPEDCEIAKSHSGAAQSRLGEEDPAAPLVRVESFEKLQQTRQPRKHKYGK